jgi:hypothetical protein
MQSHVVPTTWFFLVLLLIAIGGICLLRNYAGLRGRKLAGAFIIAAATSFYAAAIPFSPMRQTNVGRDILMTRVFSFSAFVVLLIAFSVRLYGKWLDGKLTEAEKTPGTVGLRAWLSPANLAVVGLLAFTGWLSLNIVPGLFIVLLVGALAAWPLLNTEQPPAVSPSRDTLSPEREKVIAMLEAGKITAEESTELLNALGASAPARASVRAPLTASSRLVLIGATLVLVGFFLPWFSFSPAGELSRIMGDFRSSGFPVPEMPAVGSPAEHVIQVFGGNVANGLGWAVLVLALVTALLPHLSHATEPATQRTVRLLALGAGTILVIYLATQSLRAVAFGLCITIAGYALEWVGLTRDARV